MLVLGIQKEKNTVKLQQIYKRLSEQADDCKGALGVLELGNMHLIRELEWYKLRAAQGMQAAKAIGATAVEGRLLKLQHVIKNAEAVLDEYSVSV